jgi:sugar phosphate isomerase/epimerase
MKLDFIDLTIEPPAAASWKINPREIRAALSSSGLSVVGHTAYYLPLCSPFESIRRSTVDELKRCVELLAEIGAKHMNIHPDRHAPMHDRRFIIERNLLTLEELAPFARQHQVALMIENLPGDFNTVRQLGDLLDPMPELGLHLDIGHANLLTDHNTTDEILATFGKRLCHVHLHDNRGGNADLHLPLGTGNIDFIRHLGSVKKSGYDSTITLEVFSADRHYLAYSRDRLRTVWNEI